MLQLHRDGRLGDAAGCLMRNKPQWQFALFSEELTWRQPDRSIDRPDVPDGSTAYQWPNK